ncbi:MULTISPECIES: DUF6284 family protein [unclassified Frankia]|uniref:DUF6284 family protein n=1 Tax=unclassified Frankia TaxID=2632575 RepID=UPI001EF6DC14|nr:MULTISPECIES: DUF6284 family protein [unclassified Frankia]
MVADPVEREPSKRELAAIEAEWPLIAAELAIVDAEVAVAAGGGQLAARRLAAARRSAARLAAGFEPARPNRSRRARRLGGAA